MIVLSKTKRVRPAVKWHGGKYYMAKRIVALLPPHKHYTEAYAGGLSVLLNKPAAVTEVISDLNEGLIGLYRAIRDDTNGWFRNNLKSFDYSLATFEAASNTAGPDSFLIRNRMSRGGLGKTFAWSDRMRGGQPGDVNGWMTALENLNFIHKRLSAVSIMRGEARETITEFDCPQTCHYVDPPYLHETRTAKAAYEHEMTDRDHLHLLSLLNLCQGYVVLSGYRSAMYDAALVNWERIDIDIANNSGQGKSKERRTECLWIKRSA